MATGIALLGCGYVADLYLGTFGRWAGQLEIRGVWDVVPERTAAFAAHHGLPAYPDFGALLDDPAVDVVLNLTNPHAHFETTRAVLEAGKHAYVEKPLAMDLDDARALVELARAKGLEIGCAPSSVLGETAQTLWKAVRDELAGTPRLVYAEIDDGMVHRLGYETWATPWGARWPAEDEFRVGCTLEHAGYMLTWMMAMFGPVAEMVSHASLRVPDKGPDTPEPYATPDFAASVLTFAGGMVARLTMSIVAEHDHRLRVVCDDGTLSVDEVWSFREKVRLTPVHAERWQRALQRRTGIERARTVPSVRPPSVSGPFKGFPMDLCAGLGEMAEALGAGRRPAVNHDFGLHVTEVSLAIQHPERFGHHYRPTSTFEPMEPMPWAR